MREPRSSSVPPLKSPKRNLDISPKNLKIRRPGITVILKESNKSFNNQLVKKEKKPKKDTSKIKHGPVYAVKKSFVCPPADHKNKLLQIIEKIPIT